MKKIVHIITGLNNGGAEMMLYKLLKYSNKSQYKHEVISMMDKGIIGEKIEALGIKVHTLNMKRGIPNIKAISKASKIIKTCDTIQTWMYHADFFGTLLSIINRKKLIWGIRHSTLVKGVEKRSTIFLAKINAKLSKTPIRIIINSEKAIKTHTEIGYLKQNMIVIPNGFETDFFYKRENDYRSKLGIADNRVVLFRAARWHPMKGYDVLLKAVKLLKDKGYLLKLVLCGTDMNNTNIELTRLISKLNLKEEVLLLDRRNDIPDLMSAADIYISSSISGEGFPNVIGEAMASETPCVVTDVGDSKRIVGELGIVVKPNDDQDLCKGIEKMIKFPYEERQKLGEKSRQRIKDLFDIRIITKQFESVYLDLS